MNIKRITTSIALGIATLALSTTFAFADNNFGGNELRKSACANIVGSPVIKVEQKVKNDADSGVAGNAWAMDNYKREIVVYKTTTANTYCAIVKYDGKVVTFAGASPQNTGTVAAGIRGDMDGGYRATITGTLLASPLWKIHGNVGTFDYACDANFNCPGRVSWLGQYFNSGYGFDYAWWGWKYTTKRNGTWVNASTGNSGDITGVLTSSKDKENDNHEDGERNDD